MGRENLAGVAAILEESLAPLIAADALDVVLEDDGGALEAIAEDWTLHLEGWPDQPRAWLALDDEPDDPAELPTALAAALADDALAALTVADERLGGSLATALRAVHDPLADVLAAAIEVGRVQREA